MTNLIGAGLVILSSGLYAKAKTAALKSHMNQLSALITALQIIRSEINVNLAPIGEIIHRLSQSPVQFTSQLFSSMLALLDIRGAPYFPECWRIAISEHCSALTDNERSALYELGEMLGHYGVMEECAVIDRCAAELTAGHRNAMTRYTLDSRVYTGLSLAAGSILAIVLL